MMWHSVVYRALKQIMVNNMIILAFDNTAHSKELYPMYVWMSVISASVSTSRESSSI